MYYRAPSQGTTWKPFGAKTPKLQTDCCKTTSSPSVRKSVTRNSSRTSWDSATFCCESWYLTPCSRSVPAKNKLTKSSCTKATSIWLKIESFVWVYTRTGTTWCSCPMPTRLLTPWRTSPRWWGRGKDGSTAVTLPLRRCRMSSPKCDAVKC